MGNCMPVLLSFKKFKDRDEVWKKSHLLQGSGKQKTVEVMTRSIIIIRQTCPPKSKDQVQEVADASSLMP